MVLACLASSNFLLKSFVKEKLAFPDNDNNAENKKQDRMNHLAVREGAENFHGKVPR
jgi:hypothetical protein